MNKLKRLGCWLLFRFMNKMIENIALFLKRWLNKNKDKERCIHIFYFHGKSNESREKVKKCAIRVKTLKSENREINELETESRRECLNHVLLHFFFPF